MHMHARIPRKKTKPAAPSNTHPIISPRVVPNTVFEEDDESSGLLTGGVYPVTFVILDPVNPILLLILSKVMI